MEKREIDLNDYVELKDHPRYLINIYKGKIINKNTRLIVGDKNIYFNGKKSIIARLIYEQVNGKIPEGHITSFIDDNKNNLTISNLKIVPLIKKNDFGIYYCNCGVSYLNKATIRYSHKKSKRHQDHLKLYDDLYDNQEQN